jgi:hypothetical protein
MLIHGRIPGIGEMLWAVHSIDYLPIAVVINLPNEANENFYLKFSIQDKVGGGIIFDTTEILYLNVKTMKQRYKFVDLKRKL